MTVIAVIVSVWFFLMGLLFVYFFEWKEKKKWDKAKKREKAAELWDENSYN